MHVLRMLLLLRSVCRSFLLRLLGALFGLHVLLLCLLLLALMRL